MEFDELFEYVGEIGAYQWCMYLMAIMASMFGAEAISVNFVAASMDHWCKVDALESYPHEHQKYVAIPQDSGGVYSNCDRFDFDFESFTPEEIQQWNRSFMVTNDTRVVLCNRWVYDRSEFVSTVVNKYDLVCSRRDLVPLISTLLMIGMMVGAFITGPISDKFGRRPTVLAMWILKLAAGLTVAFVNSFVGFVIARVFLGVGSYNSFLGVLVLVLEVVGPRYRSYAGVGFNVTYSCGSMLIAGIAYSIRDDKWLQFTYVSPVAVIFLGWLLLPESPRWLMVHEKYEKANKTIRLIASVNQRKLPDGFDMKNIKQDQYGSTKNLRHIFTSRMFRRRAFVLFLYWFTSNLVYYSFVFNLGTISGSVFLNTVLSGVVEIPSYILTVILFNWSKTGRRFGCSISLLGASVVAFIRIGLIYKGLDAADRGLSFVGRGFTTIGFCGIFVYTAELFPTEIRNVAMAICSFFGHVGGTIAPYVGGPLSRVWGPLPTLLYAVLSMVSGLAIITMPETLGQKMFQTISEAEEFNSGKTVKPGEEGQHDKVPDELSKDHKDARAQNNNKTVVDTDITSTTL